MSQYVIAPLVSFILLGMGISAGILGTINYNENRKSKSGRYMLYVCWCVFFWNFGYALMGLCYGDDFAYIARALALLSVSLYMYFIFKYVAEVMKYKSKVGDVLVIIITAASLIAWSQIIKKNAVEFSQTAWGYWYTSKMSWARIVQFVGIIAEIILYYIVLSTSRKNTKTKRERYIIGYFSWFGPIFIVGCLFDTLIPSLFKTAAVPGSSIAAFISSMLLFIVSRKNKAFGLSVSNVSEYVFNDVAVPVLITDSHNKFIMFNAATVVYLNCNDEEIYNRTIQDFFEEQEDSVYRLIDSNKLCKLDKTDVRDQFDELLYSIFFVQDITKEIEQLEMLEESREIAENANRAKSDFLANMSHEIRTPLNAVLGIDEMILRESTESPILDYAENIKQAGNMLLSLINDILDFSKIESGKMEIVPVPYETASLYNDISVIVESKAKAKNLKLNVEIDKNIPSKLLGDDVRIRQILINILNNSIKYTEKGYITLKARLDEKDDKYADIVFSVKDTGIGIKKEDIAGLFNAFERVDIKKNRNIEGTGLGLSITNRLLDLMGSKLLVDSEYGVGSVFSFRLRQEIIDEKPLGGIDFVTSAGEARQRAKETSFIIPTARILVVDDNKVNLTVAKGLLKKTKAIITTAMSGMESIELVKNEKFDIIMMDHMMPDMDGIETVKRIKQLEDNMSEDAAIIALTANAISGAKEMFLNVGFDDFIAKPIKVSELEEKLLKYVPADKIERIASE